METPEQRAQRLIQHDAYLREHEKANTGLCLASMALATQPNPITLRRMLSFFNEQVRVLDQYQKQVEVVLMRLQLVFKLQSEQQRADVDAAYRFECELALQQARLEAVMECRRQGSNIIPLFRPSDTEQKEGWHSRHTLR